MDSACTILLVDDDPTLTTVLAAVLRRSGYSVLCASSASQALELFQTHHISALITDLHMPKLEGAELIAQIAGRGKSIPAILITGSGEFEELYANAPGVSTVLIKPIVRATLLHTLDRLLGHKKCGDLPPHSKTAS